MTLRFPRLMAMVGSLAIVAPATVAFAQQDGQTQAPGKAELKARIKELRHKLLLNRVGLSEDKAGKVEQIIDGHNPERAAINKRIREEKRTLRELLKQNSDDQDSYAAAENRLAGARTALRELRGKQREELAAELTPKERAKLGRALARFHKRMRRLRRQERRREQH